MSTIAVVVDKTKDVQYKDYVNFLGSYKNRKNSTRDESDNNSVGYSLNSSTNSSSTDINELPIKSFNEYLQDYTNKKFQPVQTAFKGKDNNTTKKNVKTELFIQINNSEETNEHPHFNDIMKNFEKSCVHNGKAKNQKFQQIQKKFNVNPENEVKLHKNAVRLNSFESKNNEQTHFIKLTEPKDTEIHPKKDDTISISKGNSSFSSNPVSHENENIRSQTPPKAIINALNDNEKYQSKQKVFTVESSQPKNEIILQQKPVISPKILINTANLSVNKVSTISAVKKEEIHNAVPTKQENSVEIQINDCSPSMVPPPPPPPPLENLTKNIRTFSPVIKSPAAIKVQSSTLPRMMNNNKKSVQKDTVDAATLDRNDPRVKKAVYGALRNMYGAYHEKANDYLATLPKNRVKKGNGLDSIIDSIAAQGGLEKLCGRAKVEAD